MNERLTERIDIVRDRERRKEGKRDEGRKWVTMRGREKSKIETNWCFE